MNVKKLFQNFYREIVMYSEQIRTSLKIQAAFIIHTATKLSFGYLFSGLLVYFNIFCRSF